MCIRDRVSISTTKLKTVGFFGITHPGLNLSKITFKSPKTTVILPLNQIQKMTEFELSQ